MAGLLAQSVIASGPGGFSGGSVVTGLGAYLWLIAVIIKLKFFSMNLLNQYSDELSS